MAITTWAATTGDWDDSKFDRGWDGPSISPAKVDLTLSSSAPTLKVEYFVSPGVASFEIVQSYEWNQISEAWEDVIGDWSSGPVPHVAVGTGISPEKATDLTLTGSSAPKTGLIYKFVIPVGEQTLTGSSPVDSTGDNISPDNADLSIVDSYNWNTYGGTWANASHDWETAGSPYIPTAVETGHNQPDNADLTLTGQVPDWRLAQLWYIPTADLTLSTTAPDSPIGPSIEVGTGELTILQSYNWDTYGGLWNDASSNWDDVPFIPSASETSHGHVPKADLTLTGQVPVASEKHHRSVPVAAESTLTGSIPTIGGNHFRTIGAGSLTGLGGGDSWETFGGDWASASGAWGIGTITPTCGVTYTFPIDSADGFVLTTSDPEWPLIRQPLYKPQVIMS